MVLTKPQHSKSVHTEVAVNVVQVFEPAPPPNEPAVEWTLITTEGTCGKAQLERIVAAYCARWTIEEYFKALKTGCSYEQRRLESADGLLNALAVFAVVAWRLLALRTLARASPDAPSAALFSADQITLMRYLGDKRPRARIPGHQRQGSGSEQQAPGIRPKATGFR